MTDLVSEHDITLALQDLLEEVKGACFHSRKEYVYYETIKFSNVNVLTLLGKIAVKLELAAKLLTDHYHLLEGRKLTGLLLRKLHCLEIQIVIKARNV